jgi:hypothetical protein
MARTTLRRVPLCTVGFVLDEWAFEGRRRDVFWRSHEGICRTLQTACGPQGSFAACREGQHALQSLVTVSTGCASEWETQARR